MHTLQIHSVHANSGDSISNSINKVLRIIITTWERYRHHLHESVIQKVVKEAARKARISRPASCHTQRHSLAAHLLEDGYDIRTIYELLGHKDVSMNKYILILVVISFALVINAHAEYYKYVDENGNVVFTDNISNIPENQRSKVKTLREQQGAPESSGEKDLPNQYKSEEEAQRQLMDTLKKNYGAKESCPEETKGQAEQAIKATWTKMAQAMVSGNLEKAFSYFSSFSRDEMKRKMSDMSREQIKNIFSNYKSIEIERLFQDVGIAECGIIREGKDGAYSYPASFVKDIDCEWRLRGL